jgi:hypothetical protein
VENSLKGIADVVPPAMPSSANDVKLEDGVASEGTGEGQTPVTAQNPLEGVSEGFTASSAADDGRSRINGTSANSHMHFTPPTSSPPTFPSVPFGPSGPPPTSSTSTLQPTASAYNPYGAPPQPAYAPVQMPPGPYAPPGYSYVPVSMANGGMPPPQAAMHHPMWMSSPPQAMANAPFVGRQPPLITPSTPAHLQSAMGYTPGSPQYGATPLPANGGYKPGRPTSSSRAPGAGRDFSRSPSMLHSQGPMYSPVGVPFDSSYSTYPAPPYRPSSHSPSLSFSPHTAPHPPLPPILGASPAMQPMQPYVQPYTAVSAPGNASTFSGGSGNMGFGTGPPPPSGPPPRGPPSLASTFNPNSGYGSSSANKRW